MPVKKRKPAVKRKMKGGNSDVAQLMHELLVKKNKRDDKKAKSAAEKKLEDEEIARLSQIGNGKRKRKMKGGNSDVAQLMHELLVKKNKRDDKKAAAKALVGGSLMINSHYPQHGGSFFGDIGDAFSSAGNWVKNAAVDTGNFIKDKKIISNVLGIIPDPRLKAAAAGASMLGLGHKHHVRRNVLKF